MPHPALRTLARVGPRIRLALAAACLLLAAASALASAGNTAASAGERTVRVVVAARALPAGQVLGIDDLRAAPWPASLRVPGSRSSPHELVGARLAGPVGASEVITAGRLLGKDLSSGLGPDVVAMPVPVPFDVGGFVHAGNRIDLLAVVSASSVSTDPTSANSASAGHTAGESTPITAASAVRVLAVLPSSGPATSGTLSGAGAATTLLVLALARAQAVRIAALATSCVFTVVVRAP